jgi:hypothetical protein
MKRVSAQLCWVLSTQLVYITEYGKQERGSYNFFFCFRNVTLRGNSKVRTGLVQEDKLPVSPTNSLVMLVGFSRQANAIFGYFHNRITSYTARLCLRSVSDSKPEWHNLAEIGFICKQQEHSWIWSCWRFRVGDCSECGPLSCDTV